MEPIIDLYISRESYEICHNFCILVSLYDAGDHIVKESFVVSLDDAYYDHDRLDRGGYWKEDYFREVGLLDGKHIARHEYRRILDFRLERGDISQEFRDIESAKVSDMPFYSSDFVKELYHDKDRTLTLTDIFTITHHHGTDGFIRIREKTTSQFLQKYISDFLNYRQGYNAKIVLE